MVYLIGRLISLIDNFLNGELPSFQPVRQSVWARHSGNTYTVSGSFFDGGGGEWRAKETGSISSATSCAPPFHHELQSDKSVCRRDFVKHFEILFRALLVNSSTVVQFADIRLQNLFSSKICQFVICLGSKKQRHCLMNGKSEDFNREVVGMFVINHINRVELPIWMIMCKTLSDLLFQVCVSLTSHARTQQREAIKMSSILRRVSLSDGGDIGK